MTPPDAIAFALSALISLLAALRSLRVPVLRPVALACSAFVALDAARWVGLPWWADVVAFVAMPGCWAGLLRKPAEESVRDSHRSSQGATVSRVIHRAPSRVVVPTEPASVVPASCFLARLVLPRAAIAREHVQRIRIFVAHALKVTTPPALCLLYAVSLLALRHHPAVAAHWTAALQAPRIAGLALAVWVGLRWRRGSPSEPPPGIPPGSPAHHAGARLLSYGGTDSGRKDGAPPPSPQPPLLVGLTMALGAGLAAAWGLWGTSPASWWQVQALSAACWLIAGAVAARAR